MNRIHLSCEACGEEIALRRQPPWRRSRRARVLFVLAPIVGLLWFLAFVTWSPILLIPTGGSGIPLCAIVYLGPGAILLLIGLKQGHVRDVRCRCGWRREIRQGHVPIAKAGERTGER